MASESEITIAILDNDEDLLGYLNPRHVRISETNELYKLRTINITHQLLDEHNTDLSYYDSMLVAGNKIWRTETTDGVSVLYVIHGPKKYSEDFTEISVEATEVAVELGQVNAYRDDNFSWTVNNSWVTTYIDDFFDAGTLTGPSTITGYSGKITPMAMIQEIQTNTGGEFQFRYEYSKFSKRINRYIDFLTNVGTTHSEPIQLGYNAEGITLEIDESNVGIAAAPTGKEESGSSQFHSNMKAFEDKSITKGASIASHYSKDDDGNVVAGPTVTAPYAKSSGKGYVVCDVSSEIVGNYSYINSKAGVEETYPRLVTFESTEGSGDFGTDISGWENYVAINMYWECVRVIREHLKPEIEITCNLIDLSKLQGASGEHYNIGDTVYIILPGRNDSIQCRVSKTVKNPREPENMEVTISTFRTDFMGDFYSGTFKSPGSIDIYSYL